MMCQRSNLRVDHAARKYEVFDPATGATIETFQWQGDSKQARQAAKGKAIELSAKLGNR